MQAEIRMISEKASPQKINVLHFLWYVIENKTYKNAFLTVGI